MDRKQFLNRTLGTMAVIAITPQILAEKPEEKPIIQVKSSEDELFELRSREANKRLIALFEENPDLVDIIQDMIKGDSFTIALNKFEQQKENNLNKK